MTTLKDLLRDLVFETATKAGATLEDDQIEDLTEEYTKIVVRKLIGYEY